MRVAFLAAVPIEAANLKFCVFPIDVGLPAGTPWYDRLLCDQWLWIHLPAVLLSARFDLVRFWYPIFFVNGYLETALLLIAALFLFRWFRQLAKKFHPIQA